MVNLRCYQSTYEELKLVLVVGTAPTSLGYQSTYEELKLT